jgi:heme/copper-type cytochrome/quinol oxidase subunit 3
MDIYLAFVVFATLFGVYVFVVRNGGNFLPNGGGDEEIRLCFYLWIGLLVSSLIVGVFFFNQCDRDPKTRLCGVEVI